MSYVITITETKIEEAPSGKEWATLDTEEVERETGPYTEEGEPKTRIKEIRGYTPEIMKKN